MLETLRRLFAPAPLAPLAQVAAPVPEALESVAIGHTFAALVKATAPMFPNRTVEIAAARDMGFGGVAAEDSARLSYAELRQLADQADLIRMGITDVKDRVRGLGWQIETDDDSDASPEATALLEKPDGVHSWDEWASMIVEELLVCDNVTLFPVFKGGLLVRCEVIDGSTIRVLPDATGRVPLPPTKAYEQARPNGAPLRFTTAELWYRPQNRRVRSLRGYSAVEQIAARAVIVMRKLTVEVARWNKGGVPAGIIGTPETWNTVQLQEYVEYLDRRMENPARQSRMLPVAGAPKYQAVTPISIDKAGEELLIRIICKALGVDPTALVSQVNYSTADALERWAQTRGIQPVLWFLESIARDVLTAAGYPKHRLVWEAQRQAEAMVERERQLDEWEKGVLSFEEFRSARGNTTDARDLEGMHFRGQLVAGAQGEAFAGAADQVPPMRLAAHAPSLRSELRKWRAVEEKVLAKGGSRRRFESDVIPPWVRHRVEDGLAKGLPVATVFREATHPSAVLGVRESKRAAKVVDAGVPVWERSVGTLGPHYTAEAEAALKRGEA